MVSEQRQREREAFRLLLEAEDECSHKNVWFDRVFCACGDMHDYCDDCGSRLDYCPERWEDTDYDDLQGTDAARPD